LSVTLSATLLLVLVGRAATGQHVHVTLYPRTAKQYCLAAGYAEFCEMQLHGKNPADIWSGCDWEPVAEDDAVVLHMDDDSKYDILGTHFPTERCTVQAEGIEYHMERRGPYRTYGGYDWNYLLYKPFAHLTAFPYDVSSFFLGQVGLDGQVLGFPPIHEHHAHFSGHGNVLCDSMITHADDQCMEGQGGAWCYWNRLPKGYVVHSPGPFAAANEFNDVRVATRVALVSYQMTLIGLVPTSPKNQNLRMTTINFPFIGDFTRDGVPVPPRNESLFWSVTRVPDVKAIKYMYLHRHNAWLDEVLIFKGALDLSHIVPRGQFNIHSGVLPAVMAAARAQHKDVACQMTGGHDYLENVAGSAELDDHFYRKTIVCNSSFLNAFRPAPEASTEACFAAECLGEATLVMIGNPQGREAASVKSGYTHIGFRMLSPVPGECDDIGFLNMTEAIQQVRNNKVTDIFLSAMIDPSLYLL